MYLKIKNPFWGFLFPLQQKRIRVLDGFSLENDLLDLQSLPEI